MPRRTRLIAAAVAAIAAACLQPHRTAAQSAACAVTGKPCPPPTWEPTYDMAASTVAQPCNASGWFDPAFAAKFGLLSFDWSNYRNVWEHAPGPHTCEADLVTQCRKVKAINPDTKCMAYRNTELALQWMETQRAVMDADHGKRGWFLTFKSDANGTAAEKCAKAGPCDMTPRGGYEAPGSAGGGVISAAGRAGGVPVHVPMPTAAGTSAYCCAFGDQGVYVYSEPADANRGMQQFFWDFRNASATGLQDYWVQEVFGGAATGAGNPWIDGLYSDDVTGLPAEHQDAAARTGLTPAEGLELQVATGEVWTAMLDYIRGQNAYNWQAFGAGDGATAPPTPSDKGAPCVQKMEALCDPSRATAPLLMASDCTNTTTAAFLIARSPHSWLGDGWKGCGLKEMWCAQYDWDVGTPITACAQPSPGVFTRTYSKVKATLDCTAFTASFEFGPRV